MEVIADYGPKGTRYRLSVGRDALALFVPYVIRVESPTSEVRISDKEAKALAKALGFGYSQADLGAAQAVEHGAAYEAGRVKGVLEERNRQAEAKAAAEHQRTPLVDLAEASALLAEALEYLQKADAGHVVRASVQKTIGTIAEVIRVTATRS